MSVQRDPDAILADWLEEGPTRLPDTTRRSIAVTTRATNQSRRPRSAPWRSTIMTSYQKLAIAAVVVIAVGATGLAVLRPDSSFGPASLPSSPSSPSQAVVSPTPARAGPTALPVDVNLAPGGYSIGGSTFPIEATFDVPSGWAACGSSAVGISVCSTDSRLNPRQWSGRELSFLIVKNVVADPCDSTGRQLDPPVGRSVGDLVTAISNLSGFKATAPTDVTVGGHPGQEFELTAPSNVIAGCALNSWSLSSGTEGINQVAPGEINLVRVLDVDGTRLMIAAAYFPATTSGDELAELRQVFESVRFGP